MKLISDEDLMHAGVPGMKWGFNKGRKNGNRVAEFVNGVKKPFNDMGKRIKKFNNKSTYEKLRDANRDFSRFKEDVGRNAERLREDVEDRARYFLEDAYDKGSTKKGLIGKFKKYDRNTLERTKKKERKKQDKQIKRARKIRDILGISDKKYGTKIKENINKLRDKLSTRNYNAVKKRNTKKKIFD